MRSRVDLPAPIGAKQPENDAAWYGKAHAIDGPRRRFSARDIKLDQALNLEGKLAHNNSPDCMADCCIYLG